MKRYLFHLLPFAFCLCLPLPLMAQENENAAVAERMDRLEHDLMILQKQLAQTPPGSPVAVSSNMPIDNAAQLQNQLSGMEDEIRALRGEVEQNGFQVKKLSDDMAKMQKDNEFRFGQLEAGKGTPATAPSSVPETPKPLTAVTPPPPANGATTTSAGDGTLHLPPADTGQQENINNFSTPRDLYNYAFRLLNETKYEEAASAFDAFTKKYSKDPLVGNAYYWEGETFYIRRDYVSAADNFRQGFEALPEGPKAADNLLKLAMSLDALQRDKEACVVLGQITTKFKKSSTSITEKAASEQKRIGCQ